MTGTASWRLLRASATTTRTMHRQSGRLGFTEETDFRAARLTVVVQGRLGAAAAVHSKEVRPDIASLVEEATLAARNGAPLPPCPAPGQSDTAYQAATGSVPQRSWLRALPWLEPLGEEQVRIASETRDHTGASSLQNSGEHWLTTGIGSTVLARIPADAQVMHMARPAHDDARWLLSPYVLSQVLLQPLLQALTRQCPLRKWPPCDILDPAWGGTTDFEGTPRAPTCFVRGSQVLVLPADMERAGREKRAPTGHSGLSGIVLRDLVVRGTGTHDTHLPAGVVVGEGTCVAMAEDGASAVVALSPLSDAGEILRPAFRALPNIFDLISIGKWCGPWQRGAGPWTSPWLSIPSSQLHH